MGMDVGVVEKCLLHMSNIQSGLCLDPIFLETGDREAGRVSAVIESYGLGVVFAPLIKYN